MLIRAASTAVAAGLVSLLLAAAPIRPATLATIAPKDTAAPASAPQVDRTAKTDLEPRRLSRKERTEDMVLPVTVNGRRAWNGRLKIKFRDELGMRADLVPAPTVRGADEAAVRQANELLDTFGASVRRAIRTPEGKLRTLKEKAESISKKAQADLESIMFVDVRPDQLLDAAKAFNRLDIVEWSYIDRDPVPTSPDSLLGADNLSQQFGCGADGPGAGNGVVNCYTASPNTRCSALGGGAGCNSLAACTNPNGPQPPCRFGCNDLGCCEAVSLLLPNCSSEESGNGWDNLCAAYANLLCARTVYDAEGNVFGTGSPPVPAIPSQYKYDPCFALRGPVNVPPFPIPNDVNVLVYGQAQAIAGYTISTSAIDPRPSTLGVKTFAVPANPAARGFVAGVAVKAVTNTAVPGFPTVTLTGTAAGPAVGGVLNITMTATTAPETIPGTATPFPAQTGWTVFTTLEGMVPGQLLSYSTLSNGDYDAATGLTRVTYPNNTVQDEANPVTDVPQKARPDPSLEGAYVAISVGCFIPHPGRGCNDPPCCVYVCRNDPSCCQVAWDDDCVALAQAAPVGTTLPSPCANPTLPTGVFPPGGTTPMLTGGQDTNNLRARGFQAYTVGNAILSAAEPLPAGVTYPAKAPTVVDNSPTSNRTNINSNAGTLNVINSGFRGGGLRLYDVGGELSYLSVLQQLGFNQGWDPKNLAQSTVNVKGFGDGITIAVLDFNAFLNHEDLVGRVTPEQPEQTQILIESFPLNPNHGTAVLGIVGAARNTIGMTGIAWQSDIRFYPIVSRQEGARLDTAMANAIVDLDQGDVLLLPIGLEAFESPVQGVRGDTILRDPAVFALATTASSAGICVVASAGNDAAAVRTSPDSQGDSGAIVVGGAWPGFQLAVNPSTGNPGPATFPGANFCRVRTSNFTDPENPTNLVNCSGWGEGVATLGYGDLFRGTNAPISDPLELDRLRSYTADFGGTSASAAMIAGWCACIQSFSVAVFGSPLGTTDLRTQITRPSNTFLQCGEVVTVNFPGYPEDADPIVGDITRVDQVIALIGGFPRCGVTASSTVALTLGGVPVFFDVITGTLEAGNTFSLREQDGNTVRLGAVRRRAGSRGNGFGAPLIYPITGGTTDIQVNLDAPGAPQDLSVVGLLSNARASISTPVIQLVYFYNFTQQRWVSAGSAFLTPALPAPTTVFQPVGNIVDYATGAAGGGSTIYARSYTVGFTSNSYSVIYDQLLLGVEEDIFNP
jgi:hypothetical protein